MRVKKKTPYRFFDIRNEKAHQQDWIFNKHESTDYAKDLLITGANSFLGIHILLELSKIWKNNIHILIRAKNEDHAKQRMDEAYLKWGHQPPDDKNIIYHVVDLFKVNWGLKKSEYDFIQKNTGHVLHLALNAKYHLPYSSFQRDWLPEFIRMLEFCGNDKYPKSLHYTGSYVSHFYKTDEDFERINTSVWYSGYSGFKWVVEKILRQAISGNLRGCLYDIPLVLGSHKTGIGPEEYFSWQIGQLFIETGIYTDFNFKVISVDVLGKIIAQNIVNELDNTASTYVRPVFKEEVTQAHLVALLKENNVKLRPGTNTEIAAKHPKPSRVKFILPDKFYDLIKEGHELKSVFPLGIDTNTFPSGIETFIKNIEYLFYKLINNKK